jgi:hypothetical protein
MWLEMMELPHAEVQAALVITVIVPCWRTIGRPPEVPMFVLPHPVMTQETPAKLLSVPVARGM